MSGAMGRGSREEKEVEIHLSFAMLHVMVRESGDGLPIWPCGQRSRLLEQRMVSDGRIEDLVKSTRNAEYREQLYVEYGIL